jgi:hypothetical protein
MTINYCGQSLAGSAIGGSFSIQMGESRKAATALLLGSLTLISLSLAAPPVRDIASWRLCTYGDGEIHGLISGSDCPTQHAGQSHIDVEALMCTRP